MPLKTKTTSEIVHRTTLTGYENLKDGGQARLLATHVLIHSNRQRGKLTVDYGPGGSINAIVFEGHEHIPQTNLMFDDDESDLPTNSVRPQ